MLDYLRRVTPTPIKRVLKWPCRVQESLDALRDSVCQLEKRIDELSVWTFNALPEIFLLPEEARRETEEMLALNGLPPGKVNLAVSKNDVMYQNTVANWVKVHHNEQKGITEYFRSGVHMLQVLETIIRIPFPDFKDINAFLDFASGYGRLTRFLIHAIDPGRVWISDIKPRAVRFQEQQFGVHGIVSTEMPEQLAIGLRFDCIFVGSLFSHLPEAYFGRWLQKLCDLLSDRGVLAFTVHDVSLAEIWGGNPIAYCKFLTESEEIKKFSPDKALSPEIYGTLFVSEAFVRDVIQALSFQNKCYARYEKGMWAMQDIYVMSRNPIARLHGLKLPAF